MMMYRSTPLTLQNLEVRELSWKIVSSKELRESPTLCLSPLRFLGECHRCEVFRKSKDWRKLKCKPKISKEVEKLLEEKKRLLKRLGGGIGG